MSRAPASCRPLNPPTPNPAPSRTPCLARRSSAVGRLSAAPPVLPAPLPSAASPRHPLARRLGRRRQRPPRAPGPPASPPRGTRGDGASARVPRRAASTRAGCAEARRSPPLPAWASRWRAASSPGSSPGWAMEASTRSPWSAARRQAAAAPTGHAASQRASSTPRPTDAKAAGRNVPSAAGNSSVPPVPSAYSRPPRKRQRTSAAPR
jgi:hypothetical protein